MITSAAILGACAGEPTDQLEEAQSSDALRPCTRTLPTIRIEPAVSGPASYDEGFTYYAVITNNDAPSCGPSTFLYTGSSRFITAFPPEIPTIVVQNFIRAGQIEIKPRKTVRAPFVLSAPPDLVPGTYSVEAGTVNALYLPDLSQLLANLVRTSTQLELAGEPPCTRRPLTISITPTQSEPVPLGTAVDYTLTIANNDSAGCTPFGVTYGAAPFSVPGADPLPFGLTITLPDPPSPYSTGLGYVPNVAAGTTLTRVVQITSTAGLSPGVTEFDLLAAREISDIVATTASYAFAE
ncbi:MAG TPA: hypothetical protein VK524_08150 [Polyangiaceae bacterium]|nr:hypothetical protein [Polyangiaceae bacterium]